MNAALEAKALEILDQHRDMTIATLRPDGWPQATTVGYAHEGLTLYFLCGPDSQKAANLALDDRVSITIDGETPQVMDITGLSMAARARRIADPDEARRVMSLIMSRYQAEQRNFNLTIPEANEVALFAVKPTVISVLDYSEGFGHTDLMEC